MDSPSAIEEYINIPGLPICAAKLSRWMFRAHSHFVMSACPVPTYFDCRCYNCEFMEERYADEDISREPQSGSVAERR